jgi:hypothetical protein
VLRGTSILHFIRITLANYHIARLINNPLTEEFVQYLLVLLNFGERTGVQVIPCLQVLVIAQELLPISVQLHLFILHLFDFSPTALLL